MIPHRILIAIVAFLGLIAVIPMWMTADLGDLSLTNQFLAGIILPAIILLYISSWVKPSLAAPIMGVFVLVGLAAIAPTLFGFVQIGVNETDGFVQYGLRLALPVLFFVFVVTMARGRFQ